MNNEIITIHYPAHALDLLIHYITNGLDSEHEEALEIYLGIKLSKGVAKKYIRKNFILCYSEDKREYFFLENKEWDTYIKDCATPGDESPSLFINESDLPNLMKLLDIKGIRILERK